MKSIKQYKKKLEFFADDFNRLFDDLHNYLHDTYPDILTKTRQNIKKTRNVKLSQY